MKLFYTLFLVLFATYCMGQSNIPVNVYVLNPTGCPYSVTNTWSNPNLIYTPATLLSIDSLSGQEVFHYIVPDSASATLFTICAVPAPPCTCPTACAGPISIYPGIAITLSLCPTGVEEELKPFLKILPNPTTSFLWIESQNLIFTNGEYDLTIYNSCGQTAGNYKMGNDQMQLDLSKYSNGLYFYSLKNKEEIILQGKFIKE